MRRTPALLAGLALLGVASACATSGPLRARPDEAEARRRAEAYYAMVRKAPRSGEILEPLRRGQLAVLEEKLEALEQAYEAGTADEVFVFQAFGDFADPSLVPQIEAWAADRPGAWQALAARGLAYAAVAAQARGYLGATRTSPEQLGEMRTALDRSMQDLRAVLAQRPRFLAAYASLVDAARMLGDRALAQATVEAALRQDPKSFLVRTRYMRALEPSWGGSFEAMDAFAREALAQTSANPVLISLLGFSAAARAMDSLNRQDWASMVQLYTEALEYGRDPEWLRWRARGYLQQARYREALADVEEALRYTPENASLVAFRAECLLDLKRPDAALREYARASGLAPDVFWIAKTYADALASQKRLPEAAAVYERYLAVQGRDADAMEALGMLYLDQLRQPERARDWFAREVQVAPDRLSGWRYYGDSLRALRDPRAAAAYSHYLELVDRAPVSDPTLEVERFMAEDIRRTLHREAQPASRGR